MTRPDRSGPGVVSGTAHKLGDETSSSLHSVAETDDGRGAHAGGIYPLLDEPGARRLTFRIHRSLTVIAEQRDQVLRMVREAKEGNAHQALGYRSWTEYVEQEFRDVLPRLDQDERESIVVELAKMGLSIRSIAPVVGASKSTVAEDLSRSGHLDAQPVTGRDGKSYTRPAARLEFHWLGEHLLPIVASDQMVIDSVAQSLPVVGLIKPILLAADGRIFDGRLRYLACLAAKHKPHFEMLSPGLTGTDLLDRWWSLNVCRGHLTEGQRVSVAVRLERERST